MKFNGVAFIGLLLAFAAGVGVFVLGTVMNPSPAVVVVASRDLDKGTALSALGEGDLAVAEIRGSSTVVLSMLSMAQYTALAEAGAVLAEDVRSGNPVMASSVLSAENPASRKFTSLMLEDPKLVAMTISAKDLIPGGVRSGDFIDINVAIDNVRDSSETDQSPLDSMLANQPANTGTVVINGTAVPVAQQPGQALPGQAEPAAGPTPTRNPYVVPIGKTVVKGAYVASVIREQRNSTGVDGQNRVIYGDVTGLVVLIPRDTQEYVTMANAAGKLRLSLLSPMADNDDGPTAGAALSDLIDKFYNDRATLAPAPTGTSSPVMPTATETQDPLSLTATPAQAAP